MRIPREICAFIMHLPYKGALSIAPVCPSVCMYVCPLLCAIRKVVKHDPCNWWCNFEVKRSEVNVIVTLLSCKAASTPDTCSRIQCIHLYPDKVARPGYLYPATCIWCKCGLTTLGKLSHTEICLCHEEIWFRTGQRVVMLSAAGKVTVGMTESNK